MLFKALSLAALASIVSAQTANLTSALVGNPDLTNLTQYLGVYPQIVQLLSALQNVTLLAPSNAAFTKLLSGPGAQAFQLNDTSLITALFTYHVLNGTYYSANVTSTPAFIPTTLVDPTYSELQGQRVEAVKSGSNVIFYSGLLTPSTVTQANITFTGGVIHVVDTFLTIPQNITTTLVALNLTAATGALAETEGNRPLPPNLTAFIPNNAAFQAIGSTLATLSMANLSAILGYHLVPDIVAYSTDLKNDSTLTTSINETVHVTVSNGTYYVNNAKVIVPNVLVMDGVVHVIDEVLNPANSTATPNLSGSDTPGFANASAASDVPFTSGIPAPTSAIATPGAATSAAGAGASSASGSGSASSSSGIAMPMKTGAVGAAALFGGAAVFLNM